MRRTRPLRGPAVVQASGAEGPERGASDGQAINRALHDAMAADDRVLVFGEDVATLGGVFRVTEGLAETFGEKRCFDMPLAESAIVGICMGLALRGFMYRFPRSSSTGFPAGVRPGGQPLGEVSNAHTR